ncbi:MAG: hypothetical protein ACXWV0_04945 [Flavisolibacter sp.]
MNTLFARLYISANIIIMICLLSLCYFFNWPKEMMVVTAIISLVVSAPGVLLVHAVLWLLKRLTLSTGFAWIMLFASLPFAVSIPAFLFEDTLPGNEIFLIILGMMTAYAVVLAHGMAISRLFKSINENE